MYSNIKQFVYDVASLWAKEEIEIQTCEDHLIQEGLSSTVDMSLFQWVRFYLESDEKYAIKPKWASWLKMSCRRGNHKYRLTSKKNREEPLLVSELLKEYDRHEILFRHFPPVTDYKPVEQSPRKRIMYSTGWPTKWSWEERQERIKENPILFRQFGEVPEYYPIKADEGRISGLMYWDGGN